MGRMPWAKIHPYDTLADAALMGCSKSAQALFWVCWCLMCNAENRGELSDSSGKPMSMAELAGWFRESEANTRLAFDELISRRVFLVTKSGFAYQKRMVEEAAISESSTTRSRRHREKTSTASHKKPDSCNANATAMQRQCNTNATPMQQGELESELETDKRREEKASHARAKPPASLPPAVIAWMPGTGWDGIAPADESRWATAYPGLSIRAELAKADAWLNANPAKAPGGNWPAFIVRWLARSADKLATGQGSSVRPLEKRPTDAWDFEAMGRAAEEAERELAQTRNGVHR